MPTEFKYIKDLMAAMKKEGVRRISIKEKSGSEVVIEREEPLPPPPPSGSSFSSPHVHHFYPQLSHPTRHDEAHQLRHPPLLQPESVAQLQEAKKEEGRYITSPLVGTFYAAPSPDDPLFVKVGDRVEEGTVVCIIEAMKVMNEVKAGISGVVTELFLRNADPVEFGTKLFRVT
jgi:acetyl-CoA carboxylase biotin carboxyl carrier protein